MNDRRTIKRGFSWAWPVLLVAIAVGTLAFAACGSDPTPTPEPTATPQPTPTTVPTATPEPTPTPEPEPEPDSSMISMTDIDENSTVGDLIGALSDEEVGCITAAFGEVILESMKDQPLAAVAASFDLFPIDCLSQENAISAVVTIMSLEAGGFTPETQECIAGIFREDPSLLKTQAADSVELAACLTPEEAEALTPPDDTSAPNPEDIACLMEQLSANPSGQKIMAVLSGQDPSGQGLTMEESAILGQAAQACGIESGLSLP